MSARPDTVVLLDGDWTPWHEPIARRGLRIVHTLDAPAILLGHGDLRDLLGHASVVAAVVVDAHTLDRHEDRAPLLLMGGGFDQLAPASLAAIPYKRFYRGGPITEYTPDHDADYALGWALAHATSSHRPAVHFVDC